MRTRGPMDLKGLTGYITRYSMTKSTFYTLKSDHIRLKREYRKSFKGEGKGEFLSRIIENYIEYARENFNDEFESDMTAATGPEFAFKQKKSTESNDDLDGLRFSIRKSLAQKISSSEYFAKNKKENKCVFNIITHILEKYTLLPVWEREEVYFYHEIKEIRYAIEKSSNLYITSWERRRENNSYEIKLISYEVKPISIEIDSSSNYLVGFSVENGSNRKPQLNTFRISRIESVELQKPSDSFNTISVSDEEIRASISRYGAAYIKEKPKGNIIVRLTEQGYKWWYLSSIAHRRPVPCKEPKEVHFDKDPSEKYYELEFDCSKMQIRHYFFSFGEDAEIVSPVELRERFINDYSKALKKYGIIVNSTDTSMLE